MLKRRAATNAASDVLPAFELAVINARIEHAATNCSEPCRLWIDIGTSQRTLTHWDVTHQTNLVVVGVDALKSNVEHDSQPHTRRFVRVHGACTPGSDSSVVLNMHRSVTCGSLLPTRANAPSVGSGRDACIGDNPVPTRVPAFALATLLRLAVPRLARRVELLKIDVQGAELVCLQSAGRELRHVDNILLEVQDADEASGQLMYDGTPTLAQLDLALASHGHERQYCEWNYCEWNC